MPYVDSIVRIGQTNWSNMESAGNFIDLSNVLVDELVGEGWTNEVFFNPSDVVITIHYNDDDAALITYIEVIIEQVNSSIV